MGDVRSAAPVLARQRRRWRFAHAVFDETSWSLVVHGVAVEAESKPLEVLRALLLRPGEVVTKEELLDAVWPNVNVVEASLSTAVRKLRRAFGSGREDEPIIETVSGLGYRLAVPVVLDTRPVQAPATPSTTTPDVPPARRRRWALAAGPVALAILGGGLVAARLSPPATPATSSADMQREAKDALRTLDLPRIEAMLHQGWNPNTPFDTQGNAAMGILLNVCDWNPGHDKQRLLLVARTLYDAGARIDVRNIWGDTPYSIAKAKRYCGPDHPVTRMLWKICFTELHGPGEKCLAKYPAKPPTPA
jgi:DNA-binding winged helix-turn-helix (wHTH) protein